MGEAKIILKPKGLRHQLRKWLGRRDPAGCAPASVANVDLTLVTQVASEHVRQFIEAIDNYQLVSTHVVQVISHYRMPSQEGLRAQVPGWLSERIRFGVVAPTAATSATARSSRWRCAGTTTARS